jgi:hypothetical protein
MIFHKDGTIPKEPNAIFVFGSNLAGRHGAGAAKIAAQKFGAVYGFGRGPMGNAYAIPTKDFELRTRGYGPIMEDVAAFIRYARNHPDKLFFVTRVGCGYAGYSNLEMARLFITAPANCSFALPWKVFMT